MVVLWFSDLLYCLAYAKCLRCIAHSHHYYIKSYRSVAHGIYHFSYAYLLCMHTENYNMCRIHHAHVISGPSEVGVTPFLPDGKSPLTSVVFIYSSHIERAVPAAKKVGAPLSLRLAAALGHIAGHFVPYKVLGGEFPH